MPVACYTRGPATANKQLRHGAMRCFVTATKNSGYRGWWRGCWWRLANYNVKATTIRRWSAHWPPDSTTLTLSSTTVSRRCVILVHIAPARCDIRRLLSVTLPRISQEWYRLIYSTIATHRCKRKRMSWEISYKNCRWESTTCALPSASAVKVKGQGRMYPFLVNF